MRTCSGMEEWRMNFRNFLRAACLVYTACLVGAPNAFCMDQAESIEAQTLYYKAWHEVKEKYVDSHFGGQDWDSWEHKFDHKLHSVDEAYKAIQEMLSSLHDPYTRIIRPLTQIDSSKEAAQSATDFSSHPENATGVSSKLLAGNIGYIRIDNFDSLECASSVAKALKQITSAQSIILDLRHNPGGLVNNALKIADMFLADGSIVTTMSRTQNETITASGRQLYKKPLAILIDEKSASASEILAVALKDNHRATIFGATSFGKAVIQENDTLPEGAVLRITTAHYLSPNGSDLDHHGIQPDFQINSDDADEAALNESSWHLGSEKTPDR